MSTATGPAYKLKPNTDLFSIGSQLDAVREKQHLEIAQEFLDTAIRSYDYLENPQPFNEFLSTYQNTVLQELKTGDDHYRLQRLTEPILGFYYNDKRNEVYVRLVNFSKEAITAFSELSFIEKDMEYYNGSDSQLERISEEEWHDRRDAWFELEIRGRSYPNMLKLDLINPLMAKYSNICLKKVKDSSEQLNFGTSEERLKRKFIELYFKAIGNETKIEDAISAVISSTTKYSYSENNVEALHDHEKHGHLIPALRKETEKFVEEHPIKL